MTSSLLQQPPQFEQMLSSSCEGREGTVDDRQGMGDMMGVGMGEGSSLMGDKHLPNWKVGTSRVMVGLLPAVTAVDTGVSSFLGGLVHV